MLENRGKEMGSEKGGKERLFSGTGSFRVNSQGWGTQVNGKWVTVVISAFPYVLALSVGQRPVRHPKAGGTRVVRESLPKQVSLTDHPWCTLVVHPLDDTRGWGEGGCSMTWGPPIPSASSQEKKAGREAGCAGDRDGALPSLLLRLESSVERVRNGGPLSSQPAAGCGRASPRILVCGMGPRKGQCAASPPASVNNPSVSAFAGHSSIFQPIALRGNPACSQE